MSQNKVSKMPRRSRDIPEGPDVMRFLEGSGGSSALNRQSPEDTTQEAAPAPKDDLPAEPAPEPARSEAPAKPVATRRLSVNVEKQLYKDFQLAAIAQDTNITNLILDYMRSVVKKHNG